MDRNDDDRRRGDPVDQDAPLSVGVVAQLLRTVIAEQRRVRRVVLLTRLFFLALLIFMFSVLLGVAADGFDDMGGMFAAGDDSGAGGHAAVVRLDGVMLAGESAAADVVIEGLRHAFEHEHTQAVVLSINSPGGSPVQADDLHAEMLRLRGLHPDIPLYAVIGDIGASAAYYVAVAAHQIYAARASLVGSIGVMYSGFGLTGALDHLGIERRLVVAGEHKGFLDPFSPLDERSRADMQTILDTIHAQFIDRVRTGRGDRLTGGEQVFSGMVWTGEQALGLGLIDALGSVDSVARDVVGTESVVDFTVGDNLSERLLRNFASHFAHRLATLFGGLR